MTKVFLSLMCIALISISSNALAANYPSPVAAKFTLKNFKFHTGETLPEVVINYTTIGDPKNPAVVVLHGTAGSGERMLAPSFADVLFAKGQVLDATKYFIILPDAIGTGKSTKPSDGLKGKFPLYNYDDMVLGQYRLITEALGIKHLRAIVGNSMGGMHAWVWATKYPKFMDAIVPLVCQPTEMSSRNWMMRRMITDAVRNDPTWENGNYKEQPQHFRLVNVYYGIATNGGNIAHQMKAPTKEKSDEVLAKLLSNQTKMDANDFLYQWDSSRDYNPEPNLDKVKAHVLVVNAADDERNPPETGLMEKALKKVPNASYFLIPASEASSGHNTGMNAKLWVDKFTEFLKAVPVNK